MRTSALLTCALALLGCGHDAPPADSSSPDAGTLLTCPAAEKPLGTSALAATSQVFHPAGPIQVGQTVAFEVPANTASITIVEQAVQAPDSVILRRSTGQVALDNTAVPLVVKDGTGKTVFDDNQLLPDDVSKVPAFFASDSPATGTLTIPNTTAGLELVGTGLPEGTWSFVVSDFAYECTSPATSPLPTGITCSGGDDQSLYDVTVITKAAATAASPTNKLDVAIYFATTIAGGAPGSAPLDADKANAGADPDLQRMEATLRQLFGQSSSGITIGTVTYALLPADVLSTYATGVDIDQGGACGPLAQLLKNATSGDTLNIFFVSSLKAGGLQGGDTVVGVDGTIPGPSTIGGTVASGAAVSTADLRANSATTACKDTGLNLACGADQTAYIIAHEAGHFLGLYHVTESEGTLFDPLADTATCPCSSCADSIYRSRCADATPPPPSGTEHTMSVRECSNVQTACGGGTNLMFWRLESSSKGLLTPEQGRVMRANPLVQTVP